MPKTVQCPTCSKPVRWEPASRFRPFCSERCKLIDLGEWFDERHRIAGKGGEPWSGGGEEQPDDQETRH
jgi:endogenous inhibitor of DNA gyrase (YacG/DUF329 family)